MKFIFFLAICLALCYSYTPAWAQGNDFPNLPPPIFRPPQPFSVPGLTGLMLPQVINNEKKSAAEVAANDYERAAIGADSAAGYWCSPAADFFPSFGFLVCGYMAHVAASSRVYAQANRLIQRDPIDPNFRYPAEPVYLEPSQLGLWLNSDGDPAALYSNWLVWNTIEFYAWADMVRITADRAATCLLLESGNGKIHCSEWQLERLWRGLQNMVDLEHELGSKILPGMRDDLWRLGLQYEGDVLNAMAWDARGFAQGLAQ